MSTTPVTPKLSTVPATILTAGHLLTHYYYIVLILLGVFGGHVWLQEHDARVVADQTVKASQAREKDLQAQLATLQSVTASQKQAIIVQVAAVKTTPQAIAAIPTLSDLPLNARPLPNMPDDVAVNALQLVQQLGACREDHIELGACRQEVIIKDKLIGEDKVQIQALKEKPKFWARVKSEGKTAAIGYLVVEGLRIFLTGRP